MKKGFFLMLPLLAILAGARAQQRFTCDNAVVSFFSSAPLEDIDARTDKGISTLDIQTRELYFKIPVNTFQFKRSLMQEHFNSDYLETEKYPFAEFKGQLQGSDSLTRAGTYTVSVKGQLTIHGVTRDCTADGTLTVMSDRIRAVSAFQVRLADYNIKIPRLVIRNIAEVVDVKINADYLPGPS
ncbi:YceI family protein [Compostibacter hankyongensis]|uniref:Lipid/polyisoprenoid-binding YceI-like domain-containing protein n=1 Tax=Compostibacter hankyongensis TaxID=1007089 RepID=A0ABP8FET0_9BACT